MFNAEIPTRAELPSAARLAKSTILAIVAAAVLLTTVVLPAEYAIDPTGMGRALGLTQMGEIKKQLAIEAETDRQRDRQPAPAATPDRRSSVFTLIAGLLVAPAAAHPGHGNDEDSAASPAAPNPTSIGQATANARTDTVVFTLKPNQGLEYKMTMQSGGVVQYSWTVTGGKVNYDMHGTPKAGGKEKSYKKGREVAEDKGALTAAYDGVHGWFWRNRGTGDVTVTLKVDGAYSDIKRMN